MNQKPRLPLSQKAYQQIKEKIISLILRPGAQIDEGALEMDLSIGRTPIREALFRLAAEDLLEVVPNRGFFVRPITVDDVKALFEAMMILERAAVVLAARRIRSDQIKRLIETNEQLQAAMAGRDYLQVTLLNSKLHRIIYQATDNVFLRSALDQSQTQGQRLAYLCFSRETNGHDLEEHFEKVNEDHEKIIALLQKGQEAELCAAMADHVRLFHNRVLKYMTPALEDLPFTLTPLNLDGAGPRTDRSL